MMGIGKNLGFERKNIGLILEEEKKIGAILKEGDAH